MIKAKSAAPSVYNSFVPMVTTGTKEVNNFADGAAALAAGTDIKYAGALGPIFFDKYHNSGGLWAAENPVTNLPVKLISAADIATAEGH